MAEALSVAASGLAIAQVATQVGVAVFKLKQLLDEVKDVPDNIADLMQQIDCLDPALFDAECNFSETDLPSILWNDVAAKRSTAYCRNALKALTELVEELSHQVNSPRKFHQRIVSVKVVLKRATIKKLEKRLENAIRMLSLAQQSYLVALTRIQPDIIINKFTALTGRPQPSHVNTLPTSVQPHDDDSEDEGVDSESEPPTRAQAIRMKSSYRQWRQWSMPSSPFGRLSIKISGQGSGIMIQAPSWMCRQSWDLQSFRANGSWQTNLRSYCARPSDSEVFEVVKHGSPQELQRMFDMGLASPFDYNGSSGETLLHVAAFCSTDPAMIPYLLSKGLDLLASLYGLSPILMIILCWKPGQLGGTLLEQPNMVDDITSTLEMDQCNEDYGSSCTCFWSDDGPEAFFQIQRRMCPLHNHTSIESRVKRACWWVHDPTVFKRILEPEWTSDLDGLYRIAPRTGNSLLTHIMYKATANCRYNLQGPQTSLVISRNWFQLSAEIVSRVSNVDIICCDHLNWNATLSTLMISSSLEATSSHIVHSWKKHTTFLLRAWVASLKDAGFDLIQLGGLETKLLYDTSLSIRRRFFPRIGLAKQNLQRCIELARKGKSVYLIGFKYGPEPEDWDIYWDEPTDMFAGEFWELIENPPPQIPGAWEEAFDD